MFWQIVTFFNHIFGFGLLMKIYCSVSCGVFRSDKRLDGQVIIVTGSNTGMGKQAALDFARRGAKVILACMSLEDAAGARDEIVELTNNKNIVTRHLDLSSLTSVRKFAEQINATEDRLDVLVNNAGAAYFGNVKTEDGLDMGMQVNHYGPFLLTHLLIDLLKTSAPSRIVFTASALHECGTIDFANLNCEKVFHDCRVYCDSKLFNVICSNEFARRLQGTGVTSNSLHPGLVNTGIFNFMPALLLYPFKFILKFLCKTVEEGAQTAIYLTVSDEVTNVSGEYFEDCQQSEPKKIALDVEIARKLWDECCDLVGLRPEERRI